MIRSLAVLLALLLACWQFGQAGLLLAKAQLAQQLIAVAWQHSLVQQQPIRPWPWADTWPVARLQYHTRDQDLDLYILAGASGSSLAFGPGHLHGTAAPGTPGNSVVGGHRDSHFAFLQHLREGDRLRVQNQLGQWQTYRAGPGVIHNVDHGPLWVDPDQSALQLITCYPFDSLTSGGPLRYVVNLLVEPQPDDQNI